MRSWNATVLRREVMRMAGGGLFGLGAGTPSRFPYPGRPQPSPGVAPSQGVVVRATTVIVFGPAGAVSGVFVYQPGTTPALGNPPVDWMTESGHDPFGNALPSITPGSAAKGVGSRSAAGAVAVMHDGSLSLAIPSMSAAARIATLTPADLLLFSGLQPGGDTGAQVDLRSALASGGSADMLVGAGTLLRATGGAVVTGGAVTDTLEVTGATDLDGALDVATTSTLNGATTVTAGGLGVTGGTVTDTLAVNGESTLTPQVMSGHPVIEQTDQSVLTVTAIVNTAITTAWPIGANDAQAGTVYRLRAGGYGAQGSTQETLRIQLTFMGVNIGSDTLPAATIPASAQFQWTFDGSVSVVSTGAAGKARAQGTFTVWQLGGTATAAVVIGQHAAVPPAADTTVNTTAAQTVHFDVSWGAATGAPTITSGWSTLARAGA